MEHHSGGQGSHKLLEEFQILTLNYHDHILVLAHDNQVLEHDIQALLDDAGLDDKLYELQKFPLEKHHELALHIPLLGLYKMEHDMQVLAHGRQVWAHGKLPLAHDMPAWVHDRLALAHDKLVLAHRKLALGHDMQVCEDQIYLQVILHMQAWDIQILDGHDEEKALEEALQVELQLVDVDDELLHEVLDGEQVHGVLHDELVVHDDQAYDDEQLELHDDHDGHALDDALYEQHGVFHGLLPHD